MLLKPFVDKWEEVGNALKARINKLTQSYIELIHVETGLEHFFIGRS